MKSAPPAGKLISGVFGDSPEAKIEQGAPCRHLSGYVVSEAERSVTCTACGATIDPIDVLLSYAREERRWRNWRAETGKQVAKVEALKAEEKRVKARTKNASRKDAQVAVDAERARAKREKDVAVWAARAAAREVAKALRAIERL